MHGGGVIFLGMLAYTCQLYMDFSGIMDMSWVWQNFWHQAAGKLPPSLLLQKHFRILDPVAHHLGRLVPGLHLLPPVPFRPAEKADGQRQKASGQPLRPPDGGHHCPVLCLVLQRPVARVRVELSVFRHVPFLLHRAGQHDGALYPEGAGLPHIHGKVQDTRVFRIIRTALLVCVGELFFRANGRGPVCGCSAPWSRISPSPR